MTRRSFKVVGCFFLLAACTGRAPSHTGETGWTPDTDTDDTDTGDTDTGTPPASCDEGPSDIGTWFGGIDPTLVTSDAYTNDAGVAALVAAAPADGEEATGTFAVSGATVTNVGYPPTKNFWFADANGAMRTYLYEDAATEVLPGMIVNFTATTIKNYFGEIEVTAVSDFEVVSSGNPVQVVEALGANLDYATQGRQMVHTYGQITAFIEECGTTSSCWTFTHGGADIRFRISNEKGIIEGDCVEVVAPVASYTPDTLFDVGNWDWMRWY